MSQLWNLTLANDLSSNWKFSRFQPGLNEENSLCCFAQVFLSFSDKVVVLLGANDLSTPPQPSFEAFSTGLNALLSNIELAYPKAKLVVTCGPTELFCFQDYQVCYCAVFCSSSCLVQGTNCCSSQRSESFICQHERYEDFQFLSHHSSFSFFTDCFPDMQYPNKYFGCDGHPSALGATFMEKIIQKALLD